MSQFLKLKQYGKVDLIRETQNFKSILKAKIRFNVIINK